MGKLERQQDRKLRSVARRLEDLHTDAHRTQFINSHARQIFDGWWGWTNLRGDRVRRNIAYACATAGKEYGKDVQIDYKSWGLDTSNLGRPWLFD
jgi:hypothetical protein